MVSKVLFLVLVGCAFVLAKPIEESTEVDQPKVNVEVVEISEEEAEQIYKDFKEKFDKIWNEISNPSSKGFDEVFEEIKNVFDKIFKEHKPQEKPVESAESVESQEKTVEPEESVESQEKTVEPQESVEKSVEETQEDKE